MARDRLRELDTFVARIVKHELPLMPGEHVPVPSNTQGLNLCSHCVPGTSQRSLFAEPSRDRAWAVARVLHLVRSWTLASHMIASFAIIRRSRYCCRIF